MSNTEAITDGGNEYIYGTPPPDVNKKVTILTTGGTAVVQKWGTGQGAMGWAPLPKRNKKREEELGF